MKSPHFRRRSSSSGDSGEPISPKKIRRNNQKLKKSFADDFHLGGGNDFPLGSKQDDRPQMMGLFEETKHELKQIG